MKYLKWLVFAACILFIAAALSYINNDFWQDEIYTLQHFVFVPLSTTLTDYHVANNHILFNVILNIYRHILGINDLQHVLLHPYYFRIVPLIISLAGIIIFYKTVKKLFNHHVALIALSIYVTTFAIINFSVQLRGYTLNIVLCTVLLYYYFKLLTLSYFTNLPFIQLFLASFLVVFCLPVNIYLIGALMIVPLLLLIKSNYKFYFANNNLPKVILLKIIFSLIAGILIAAAYYVWLYSKQIPTDAALPFHVFAIENLLQAVAIFFHFTHVRVYIYLAIIVFAFLYITSKQNEQQFNNYLLMLLIIYVGYFIFCFIHGTVIIQRFFLSLIPVYCLIIALIIARIFNDKKHHYWLLSFLILNIVSVIISLFISNNTAKQNNSNNLYTHDLINQYYLINFNPKETVFLAEKLIANKTAPLYLDENYGGSGIAAYLNTFHLSFEKYTAENIKILQAFYVITNHKLNTENVCIKNGFSYKRFLATTKFFNIYYCYKESSR